MSQSLINELQGSFALKANKFFTLLPTLVSFLFSYQCLLSVGTGDQRKMWNWDQWNSQIFHIYQWIDRLGQRGTVRATVWTPPIWQCYKFDENKMLFISNCGSLSCGLVVIAFLCVASDFDSYQAEHNEGMKNVCSVEWRLFTRAAINNFNRSFMHLLSLHVKHS